LAGWASFAFSLSVFILARFTNSPIERYHTISIMLPRVPIPPTCLRYCCLPISTANARYPNSMDGTPFLQSNEGNMTCQYYNRDTEPLSFHPPRQEGHSLSPTCPPTFKPVYSRLFWLGSLDASGLGLIDASYLACGWIYLVISSSIGPRESK